MSTLGRYLNRTVAAFAAAMVISLPAAADDDRLESLFDALEAAETPAQARRVAKDIEHEFSKSGSPAMDLLLKRGQDALETGDSRAAIEHLSALTDHAPDFAQGWHMRSVAYAREGLFGPALADIERALALRPRHYDAIYGLGVILEEVSQPDLAHEAFSRVLAIHPHHEDATKALERLGPESGGREL